MGFAKRLDKRVLSLKSIIDNLEQSYESDTLFFIDLENDDYFNFVKLDNLENSYRTKFQKLDVVNSQRFGKMLILDGCVQLAESDEFIYHEMLIHPAALLSGEPRNALILGGGDGCALRELVKYKSLQKIVLVDIDSEVVNTFKNNHRSLTGDCWDDPRAEVLCEDGLAYLENSKTAWDLIIADLTEPYDTSELAGELAFDLYTKDFFRLAKNKLKETGVFVVQSGGIGYRENIDKYHIQIVKKVRDVFPSVLTAYDFIPSFTQMWSITFASSRKLEPLKIDVDKKLEQAGISGLKFYDAETNQRIFSVPKTIRTKFENA